MSGSLFYFISCFNVNSILRVVIVVTFDWVEMVWQVSGLKSITSKHLALASQVISFTYAIIPGR
jgi:hypothetical protein